jgi:hypothetical protein
MNLDLNDEETDALLAVLDRIIDGDRFPFSPRIRMLKSKRSARRSDQSRRTIAAVEALRAAACYSGAKAAGLKCQNFGF